LQASRHARTSRRSGVRKLARSLCLTLIMVCPSGLSADAASPCSTAPHSTASDRGSIITTWWAHAHPLSIRSAALAWTTRGWAHPSATQMLARGAAPLLLPATSLPRGVRQLTHTHPPACALCRGEPAPWPSPVWPRVEQVHPCPSSPCAPWCCGAAAPCRSLPAAHSTASVHGCGGGEAAGVTLGGPYVRSWCLLSISCLRCCSRAVLALLVRSSRELPALAACQQTLHVRERWVTIVFNMETMGWCRLPATSFE
jgi:hypothetical protein